MDNSEVEHRLHILQDLVSIPGEYPESLFREELGEEKLLSTSWPTSLVGGLATPVFLALEDMTSWS